MTFEEHIADAFKDALQDLDSRVCEELGAPTERVILRLRNHAGTLTHDQCRKLWLAMVECLALPRFIKD